MGRDSRYTPTFRAEVVAYARIAGAEQAASEFRIGKVDTVRSWMAAAGDGPELDLPAGRWEAIFDLASAKVQAALTSGKLSAVQAATIAGIAARNRDRTPREPEPERSPAERFVDALEGHVPAGKMTQVYVALIGWADSLPDDAPVTEDAALAFLASLDLDQWRRDRAARDAAYGADVVALVELSRLAHTGDLDADTRDYARAALDEARAAIRTRHPDRFTEAR